MLFCQDNGILLPITSSGFVFHAWSSAMKCHAVAFVTAFAALVVATAASGQTPAADPTAPATRQGAAATAPATTPAAESYASPGTESPATPDDVEAQRLKIWNGPQMAEAREWVLDRGRRSTRFTTADATRFLADLRQRSPAEMQQWLERYAARRAQLARSADVTNFARQLSLEHSISRLQRIADAYDNINAGQSEAALAARDRIHGQQEQSLFLAGARQDFRTAMLTDQSSSDYQWIIFPPLRTLQRAAATTTPGDLPASDPNNFLRDVADPGNSAPVGGSGAGPNAGGINGGPNGGPGPAGP
jgi:hypothetical protein